MSETLGSAILILRTDDAALNAGIAKAKTGAESVGAKFAQVGRQIVNTFALPVIGLGASILKTAADFETGMNRVRALTGATGGDFSALENQARDLGATTQFSASEAADAMGFLAQAGFNANEIIGSMPATLNLAAAAQTDLGTTADIVSNIMTGYGLTTEETTHATDVLTATFTKTNTNLQQLGDAMKYAGPVAHGFGIAFEEAAAAVGLMGNAGIQASMAGTSLRGALVRLATPTDEASKIMKELGLNAFDSSGNMVPLVEIVKQLETSGATTAQIMEIFGQRAGPGLQALVDQGSAALAKLTKEVNQSGITADIAKVQMEGLKGQMLALKSAWTELVLTLADLGVLEWFTDTMEGLTYIIRDASTGFQDLQITIVRWAIKFNEALDSVPFYDRTKQLADLRQEYEDLLKERYNLVGANPALQDSEARIAAAHGLVAEKAKEATKETAKHAATATTNYAALANHKSVLEGIADGYQVLGENLTNYVLAPLKEFLATAKEIDANGYGVIGMGTGPPPETPWWQGGNKPGDTFAGVGNQFAGQFAGVSGAIAGFQQGGPAGAVAGFFADLLLRNEKMQELIGTLNEALIPLVDPIVDAIAPSLEAIAPILEELAPVFHLIGQALGLYMAPVAIGLGAVGTGLRVVEVILHPIGEFLERLGHDIETLLAPLLGGLVSILTPVYLALTALPGLIQQQIHFLFVDLPQNIADAIRGVMQWLVGQISSLFAGLPGDIADAVRDALSGGTGGHGSVTVGGETVASWHSGGLVTADDLVRLPGMAPDEGLATLQAGEHVIPRGRNVTIALEGDDDALFSKRRVRRMLAALRDELSDDASNPLFAVTG